MTPERADEIVAHLVGSCQSIESCLDTDEDVHDAVLIARIGENIFNCTACGWWCENEEMSDAEDGPQCIECAEG